MDITIALPEIHRAAGPFPDPGPKILVGHEKDISVRRSAPHDSLGVPAGADHVGERFHARAAIDVGDNVVILFGVRIEERFEFFRRARFRERASRIQIGQENFLRRIQDLRGLRHEMNAAKKNDIRVGLRGLIAQA